MQCRGGKLLVLLPSNKSEVSPSPAKGLLLGTFLWKEKPSHIQLGFLLITVHLIECCSSPLTYPQDNYESLWPVLRSANIHMNAACRPVTDLVTLRDPSGICHLNPLPLILLVLLLLPLLLAWNVFLSPSLYEILFYGLGVKFWYTLTPPFILPSPYVLLTYFNPPYCSHRFSKEALISASAIINLVV